MPAYKSVWSSLRYHTITAPLIRGAGRALHKLATGKEARKASAALDARIASLKGKLGLSRPSPSVSPVAKVQQTTRQGLTKSASSKITSYGRSARKAQARQLRLQARPKRKIQGSKRVPLKRNP